MFSRFSWWLDPLDSCMVLDPHAQPPLGDLRFRHPKPIGPWEGVKDTSKLPYSCIQVRDTMQRLGFKGSEQWYPKTPLSEDCLYLNVVVPKPCPTSSAVILWIHTGGSAGTSTLELYNMISIQYRVASLGFLNLDNSNAPGNAGLFDHSTL